MNKIVQNIVNVFCFVLIGYIVLQVIPTMLSSDRIEVFLIGVALSIVAVAIILGYGIEIVNKLMEKKNVN